MVIDRIFRFLRRVGMNGVNGVPRSVDTQPEPVHSDMPPSSGDARVSASTDLPSPLCVFRNTHALADAPVSESARKENYASISGNNHDSEYFFHEACRMFPEMPKEEFERLVEDIRINKQREAIIVLGHEILDGRHRFLACKRLGIKPIFKDWDGQGSVLSFVLSANLCRRHLGESARATAAARFILIRERDAKATNSMHDGYGIVRQKEVVAEVAEIFNVGTRTVEFALKVLRDGVSDLLFFVEKQGLSISGAAVIANEPAQIQVELLAAGLPAIQEFLRKKRCEGKLHGRRGSRNEPVQIGSLTAQRKKREYRLNVSQDWQSELRAAIADSTKFERLLRSGIRIKLEKSAQAPETKIS